MSWTKEQMADEVIKLFIKNCSVNLGIGLPSIVAERLPPDLNIMVHSENGILGVGERPTENEVSPTLINAGKETVTIIKGASYFDSSLSFGMIRGGHIDFSVLGGMEVDVAGNLANWMIPGKKVTGMGGAMDLVNGSKNVIVMMNHFTKKGIPKLKDHCELPLTGAAVVNMVVTEMGMFSPDKNKFKIIKLAEGAKNLDLGPVE
ncbi:MAG: succinyl-CoA--3-ketoacid-CoA transferase [Epsilonproteobacteria bacterium]|nr:MAG: succinyl-CoA--3-ketoacid-CoA transferase [Campylobacterota bacterium]RLA64946.1 MAG: succinyl-CoA--3-ketoacid-CoA transferase [Campylobacterota bacterium]